MSLSTDAVHVWRASLEAPAEHRERLRQVLSADEQHRAARFHFERDRHRYIVGRGTLRILLGRYLAADPAGLHFRYNSYGKPALADHAGLCFNLSHTGDLALYALSYNRRVGVDLEAMGPLPNPEELAQHVFSDAENAVLRTLPARRKQAAFYACWTRKEAYIKAHGQGLSLALASFDVSMRPGEPATLLHTRPDPHEAARWSLRAIDPGAGYAAAVAVEGHDWRLVCREWSGV